MSAINNIKSLIDLVADENMAELVITEQGKTVRLLRRANAVTVNAVPAVDHALPASVATPSSAPVKTVTSSALTPVKAAMTGVFYHAASLGGEPFVQLGQSVAQGDTVCIIEAMKMMNQIEAPCAGVIAEMCCQNGQAIEQGDTLFMIEPAN